LATARRGRLQQATHLAALEHDPPADLVAEVGQRPTHPVAAEAWRSSVVAIERFQAAHRIDHAEVARDREASHEPQGAYELVASQVDLTQTSPAQRQGIERADGMALDL
jgi:hypothetical protein